MIALGTTKTRDVMFITNFLDNILHLRNGEGITDSKLIDISIINRQTNAITAVFSERELTFTFAICYRPSVCRLSSVCNVRAPYSGGSNFRQYFYGVWYPSHPLTSTENFTEIVPGEPLRRGELNTRGVVKYSDFGPIDGYITETVQDRRQVSINHL